MLNCFFSLKYSGRSDLFELFEIWKDEKLRKLQGTYPVIFMTFAGVKGSSFFDTVKGIKLQIVKLLSQYQYLFGYEGFDENEKRSLKIVRTFKDSGEQRISSFMALVFYEYTKHIEDLAAITYIPARASAYRKRGFDHMALVAHKLSLLFQIPVVQTLFSKEQQDQRALSRKQRQANAQYMFEARADAEGFYDKHILLIDDVFTTGATLYNAQKCLEDQGFTQVTCAVFARS